MTESTEQLVLKILNGQKAPSYGLLGYYYAIMRGSRLEIFLARLTRLHNIVRACFF